MATLTKKEVEQPIVYELGLTEAEARSLRALIGRGTGGGTIAKLGLSNVHALLRDNVRYTDEALNFSHNATLKEEK